MEECKRFAETVEKEESSLMAGMKKVFSELIHHAESCADRAVEKVGATCASWGKNVNSYLIYMYTVYFQTMHNTRYSFIALFIILFLF